MDTPTNTVPSVRDGEEVGHLERVRHVKRGTEYEVLGEAEAQVSYDRIGAAHRVGRPLWDECRLTVYRCAETGKLWARFTDEFRDGRFETIAAAPVSSSGDFSGDLAEIAAIREMLLAGQGDDVGKQILPDLTEDMSLFAMVASCIHLLEKRRDAIEHIEFAAPVSSTGDGDGGELERLSRAATSGEWSAEEGGRITAAGTSPGYDIPVWGTILTARDTKDIEDGVTHWATDGERQANARYVAALVNAHRSGKLVLASGSGEEKGETLETIAAWCEQTFGPVEPARIAKRAAEEMDELLAEPTKVEEAADVVIVLSRYPGLWEAVERKMAVNRARKWRLMGDGTGYHVKAGTPEPSPQSSPTLKTGSMTVEEAGSRCGFDPTRGFAEIAAKQATLGLGLVDITIIRHEGKAGVLFSPRAEHVEFGNAGCIEAGEHWPSANDIVLWVDGKGAGVAISHLAQLGPEGLPAMSEWEALEVIGQLPTALTAEEHASAFRSAATRCASTAPARSRRLDARADRIETALRTLQDSGEVHHDQ